MGARCQEWSRVSAVCLLPLLRAACLRVLYTHKIYRAMRYSNGDRYEGNWKNDKRSGKGEMRYANGDSYVGNWKLNRVWMLLGTLPSNSFMDD